MTIPSPYFECVPGIGDLEMDEILVDYDYPLLSVLKSRKGQRFLCMCYDVSGEKENVVQRWIIISISIEQLKDLLQNKIKLIAPFQEPGAIKLMVEWKFSTKEETYTQLNEEQEVPEQCLPAEDEYLDAEPHEWDDYIAALNPPQAEFLSEDYTVLFHQNDSALSTINYFSTVVQKTGNMVFNFISPRNALFSAYAQDQKGTAPHIWSRTGISEVRYGGESVFGKKFYARVSLQELDYDSRTVSCALSR